MVNKRCSRVGLKFDFILHHVFYLKYMCYYGAHLQLQVYLSDAYISRAIDIFRGNFEPLIEYCFISENALNTFSSLRNCI